MPAALYLQEYFWYSFLLEAKSTPGLTGRWKEALGQLENPVTLSKIRSMTFPLVEQYLNQLSYCMPLENII
jgi:hypothetical protein